ncbi:MAG: hypothetical protein HYZ23_07970 [Chloroflexi bacterium]|nr:hypothetical protein [Chloroflexota bacterium]
MTQPDFPDCPICNGPLRNMIREAGITQCQRCAAFIEYDRAGYKPLDVKSIPATNIKWAATCALPDGTHFATDGHIILDTTFLQPNEHLPEKTIPAETFLRVLDWPAEHYFGIEGLIKEQSGQHYAGPRDLLLNGKYVDFLLTLKFNFRLYFRANKPNDPIVLFDGNQRICALMPMKRG